MARLNGPVVTLLRAIFIALAVQGEAVAMVVWHELRPDFKLITVDRPEPIPPHLEARVNEIWNATLAENPHGVYDGPIHAMLRHSPDEVTSYHTSFRYLAACRQDAELAAALSFAAIGVTGMLTCPGGLVFGRRAGSVASNQGRWELAPAGVLSQESPRLQLMEELQEELGIPANRVDSVQAIGATHDTEDRVFDLVMRLHVPLTEAEVRDAHRRDGSSEHTELAIVPANGIAAFLDQHSKHLVPLVVPALTGAGMLPKRA